MIESQLIIIREDPEDFTLDKLGLKIPRDRMTRQDAAMCPLEKRLRITVRKATRVRRGLTERRRTRWRPMPRPGTRSTKVTLRSDHMKPI